MRIIAVDDEKFALQLLMEAIQEVMPEAQLKGFRGGKEALEYVKNEGCQIAFLDIEMREMGGIVLAKQLKLASPEINIIFTTGYSEYACDAFSMHASGYILKPITKEKVLKEIEELRHPIANSNRKRMRIKAFGNFEVFVEDKPLKFKYTKTKELLAYLIDRNGAMCSNGEIIAVLWEDDGNIKTRESYLKNIRRDLISTLDEYGCDDAIIHQRGSLGIQPDKVECDYYDWIKGELSGINAYRGEYMQQYTWGELTHGEIESLKDK